MIFIAFLVLGKVNLKEDVKDDNVKSNSNILGKVIKKIKNDNISKYYLVVNKNVKNKNGNNFKESTTASWIISIIRPPK